MPRRRKSTRASPQDRGWLNNPLITSCLTGGPGSSYPAWRRRARPVADRLGPRGHRGLAFQPAVVEPAARPGWPLIFGAVIWARGGRPGGEAVMASETRTPSAEGFAARRTAIVLCWLCGIRLQQYQMVPDGGHACGDIRWYCRDTRACTERWTSARHLAQSARAASGSLPRSDWPWLGALRQRSRRRGRGPDAAAAGRPGRPARRSAFRWR